MWCRAWLSIDAGTLPAPRPRPSCALAGVAKTAEGGIAKTAMARRR